jgi:uncharacterized LabA/DUF88 family protein
MDETLIFLDAGFLSKLSKFYGGGKYLKYDLIKFSHNLARKQDLSCKKIFYYTAPPFQSERPSKDETCRREKYDKFIKKISQKRDIIVREGRCQRLKIDRQFMYKQKAVDALMIIDLMNVPKDYPFIKKILLVASDSDFVPVIESVKNSGVEVILCTHYTKKRKTNFSRSNILLKTASSYLEIKKQDFDSTLLEKEENTK